MSKVDNIKKAWDRRGRSAIKPIIKDWLERGYSRKFIADNLGVSQPYISMVSNGKR
jgi:predicted XRE-type DNA-binding protein